MLSLIVLLGLFPYFSPSYALSGTNPSASNIKGGTFIEGGDTKVSAMMMFLGNEEKVYILDKAEGNPAQVKGHPAWGSVWDINTRQTDVMDVETNVFCSSGMHLPNGSYATFGGNGAVGRGGKVGSQPNNEGSASWDADYQDFDGARAIRILNPCKSSDNFASPNCQWFDKPDQLAMKKKRWYSAAEPLADGTIVLIGGFVNGGYVNRNFPNDDPTTSHGAAEPTFEFYPARPGDPERMQFMTKTSGLNAYAHTFLMPSGKMFVQANLSTSEYCFTFLVLWDYDANTETDLPDMPNGVARVYPASGAVAMLPLTPVNNYAPTILFCGGSAMPADAYGDYANPSVDTWNVPASKDCQRITPEPTDGSAATYVQDDDMLEGRTMSQFIILPNGKLFLVNGGLNGTAGYADKTGQTPQGAMPFGMSLASGPVGTPAIYDPTAPKGSRWSNAGLATSKIARLYHSSAILLPDASVLIGGSNPNVDVNMTTVYPTEYRAEIFYPPYFSVSARPMPTGIPKTLSYGGDPFEINIPASSYSGTANTAAEKTTVVLVRGGFTTHGMNMGQRFMQLKNTFTVKSDGSITLHVAQVHPNPNIFQPGPALLFVNINGIPSNGTLVIVGTGAVGKQPTGPDSTLPDSIRLDSVQGTSGDKGTSGGGTTSDKDTSTGSSSKMIIGGVVGAIVILGGLGAVVGMCVARRRKAVKPAPSSAYPMNSRSMGSDSNSGFATGAWNSSTTNLTGPYTDEEPAARASGVGHSLEYDRRMSSNTPTRPHY
ncbi:copper radical oxidase [Infundibulicybe gibba]|nr:copper radical oxidase [Infundibulicybe gibba]